MTRDDAELVREPGTNNYGLTARLVQGNDHGGLVAFRLEGLGQGDFEVSFLGIAQFIALYEVEANSVFDSNHARNNNPLAINDGSFNNTIVHFDMNEVLYFGYWDDNIFVPNDKIDPTDGFGWAAIQNTKDGLELIGSATAESLGIVVGAATQRSPHLLGDVNLDGTINLLDVSPFVSLLNSGGYLVEADTDQNCQVNLLDVGAFVDLLSGN